MTNCILTFIDVLTSCWCADESLVTHTFSAVTNLSRPAVLLLVTSWLADAVNTDFSLQTVSVIPTNLDAESFHAAFSTGTVSIDLAAIMTHAILTLVVRGTSSIGAEGGNSDTALLRGWHTSKSFRT